MKGIISFIKSLSLWTIMFVIHPDGSSFPYKGLSIAQQNDLLQSYWGSFTKFKKEMCHPTDKETFDKLLKAYKGAGYYIPLHQERVVKEAIQNNLPILEGKINWIKDELEKMNKLKELPAFSELVKEMQVLVENNTKLRYGIDLGQTTEGLVSKEAKEQVTQFKQKFSKFVEAIFYLKNYTYPVDHHFNRLTYDRLAAQAVPPGTPAGSVPSIVIQKLSLFLKRKFLEDGAMDPDLTRTDLFVRTTLDTLTLALKKVDIFFTPEVIRDWDWIARSAQGIYSRGLNQQKLRFEEWLGRMQATKDYYQGLLKQEQDSQKAFLSELAVSAEDLRTFTEKKLALVYKYWLLQPEALRILFVLETILMHEVGGTDPIGDQRKKVVEVVLNRVHDKAYHFLKSSDPWETLLGMKLRDKQHWWLNVMYRKGEFSFMYFYMKSSYQVFCPDDSNAISRLREENLKLSLEVLKNYEPEGPDTNVYRYFSRISMLGRIDMTAVWSPPFELVEEAPGSRLDATEEAKYLELWKQNKWKYFYSFKEGLATYRVFELDGKLWTTLWGKNAPTQFFHYRDRDYFKFFRLPK